MKFAQPLAALLLVFAWAPVYAGSATPDEAALWTCFDRMELAEYFDSHSAELYEYNNFPFTYEGKEYNIKKLENDLLATPYRFGASDEQRAVALTKLSDTQKRWVTIVAAARAASRTPRANDELKRRTYTFADGRLDGVLVPGWPTSNPERAALGSSIRPYAYAFVRGELSGRSLYLLTDQGVHKIPLGAGSGPYFIPFAAESQTSSNGMIISTRGGKVNLEFHRYAGYTEGSTRWIEALERSGSSFLDMTRKAGATPIDLAKYRKTDPGSLAVVREELGKIAKAQADSFSAQLAEVRGFTPIQNEMASRRFASPQGFARNLMTQYTKAISACSIVGEDVIAAATQMSQSFNTTFSVTMIATTVTPGGDDLSDSMTNPSVASSGPAHSGSSKQ